MKIGKKQIYDIKQLEKKSISLSQENLNSSLEPRQLDTILTEIALICQKSFYFSQFLEDVLLEEQQYNPSVTNHIKLEDLRNEELEKSLAELVTCFITMQDFYAKQSVQKVNHITHFFTIFF